MSPIEIRRDGVIICICADESCLYPSDILRDMKTAGYKFYQDGKVYKPEKNSTK